MTAPTIDQATTESSGDIQERIDMLDERIRLRERAAELMVDVQAAAEASDAAQEAVIARSGTQDAATQALAHQRGVERSLSLIRRRIEQVESRLSALRQADETEARRTEAIEAVQEAAQLSRSAIAQRESAAAALRDHSAVAAFVSARQDAEAARIRALELLRSVADDDRQAAIALLEENGLDPSRLMTPAYPAGRFLDRRQGPGWGLPVAPLWKEYPECAGGEVLDTLANYAEFGRLTQAQILLGG